MASKTVSDLKIKVGLQGEATFSRLKGQFRALEKTVGVTDKGIQELRRGVLEFSRAGGKSTQLINGQIQALKGLQAQTTINSGTYNKLTKDIEKLNTELGQLDGSVTKVKNNLGSFTVPGYGTDQFASAIQARRQELNGLAADSREYLELLTGIRAYERRQGFVTGRQEVSAAAEAAKRTMPARAMAVGLPDTYAGLRQRISELTAEIDHLEIGSDDLRNAENELIATQRALSEVLGQTSAAYDELARKEQGAIRRAKKLADIQEYYRTQGPRSPLFGTGGYRDPVTGAMIAGGTPSGIVPLRRGTFRGDNIFPTSSVQEMMALRGAGGRPRPRMGAGGYAQVAGAALSGGIFGGPEGAGGALIGGVVGGVPGAFAGAAAGAQVSMIREALAGTASYAAELEKMRIALRGVAKGQDEYEKGLAVAATVTQQFNVPQQTAIEGMTRLTAAVKGANGNVGDAALVFRNVTAAIKATGGGAQDVQSAITAMVQVFSKGKVSAEELSGQLGERLPGAVTMFAEANKMTLPELQKNLRDGTVGLDELMKFIVKLGDTYQGTAREISDSNAEAGARLTITINSLREKVGQALGPIGAAFQNAFNEFIKDIAPQVVVLAQKIAKGLKLLLDNTDKIAGIAKFAAAFAGVNLVLKAFTAMQGPISTTFTLLQGALGKTSQQSIVAQQKLGGVLSTLQRMAAIGVITVGVNYVINRIEKAKSIAAIRARLEAGGTGATLAGQSRETIEAEQKQAQRRKLEIEQEFAAFTADQQSKFLAYQVPVLNTILAQQATEYSEKLGLEYRDLQTVLKLDPSKFKSAFEGITPTDFADPTGGDGDSGGKGKRKMLQAELALRDQVRLAIFKNNQLERLGAEYALDKYMAALETEDPIKRENELREALSKFEQGLLKYREDQSKEAERQNKLAEEAAKKARDFNADLQDRQYQLGLITQEKYNQLLIDRERARLEEQLKGVPGAAGMIEAGAELKRREVDPTFAEGLQTQIAILKRELKELTDPVNALVNGATAIGTAFSDSFINVISGSQSAKEALADFFKNVGAYFLDMANQIIAKMIVMALLNTLAKVLPTGGDSLNIAPASAAEGVGYGGGAATDAFKAGTGSIGGNYFPSATSFSNAKFGMADGGYVMGGFNAFANGGVVSKPTLGLVGEGGEAEYIIPSSKMRGAMKRYSAGARGASVIPGGREEPGAGEGGMAVATPIDVRYTVERINEVDYVTADQFRSGMQQAAEQGARRGEQRTLANLRQNTTTRRKLGL